MDFLSDDNLALGDQQDVLRASRVGAGDAKATAEHASPRSLLDDEDYDQASDLLSGLQRPTAPAPPERSRDRTPTPDSSGSASPPPVGPSSASSKPAVARDLDGTSSLADFLGGDSAPQPSAPSVDKVAPAPPPAEEAAPDLEAAKKKPPPRPDQSREPAVEPRARPKVEMEAEKASSTTGEKVGCCFTGGWWNPACLHPAVEELIYWRQVKKSGLVFGAVLAVLLSLTCFSLISVVAYLALGALTVAIAFRVYRNVLQAVQKSSEGHPFKEYLDKDLSVPKEKVHEAADVLAKHADQVVARLRSLFLVEDLVDSLKLALLLWVLTYVGSWFNGMTLIILAYVALFTLPKVYETYKTEIDQYLSVARTHVGNVLGSIKSKIPIGQRPKED
ncbi:reticulon-3 isoform X1 [Ixodes scapularis]